MTIEHITKEFPNLVVKDLQGGANVYLPGELVLTFWFKKRKWKSNKRKDWRRFADTEDGLNVIRGLEEVQMKKPLVVTEIKPQPMSDNGVQTCIDHVNRKIAVAEKLKTTLGSTSRTDNAVLTMLKTLAQEFEMYL